MKKQIFIPLIVAIMAIVLIFTITSCQKDPEVLATVETLNIEEISAFSALAGGLVKDIGSHPIVSQGVCYSSSNTHPTLSNKCLVDETNSQSFQLLVEELEPNTLYHLRAFAQNEVGVSYGKVVSFTTIEGLPTVETLELEEISFSSALAKGIIHDEGDSPVFSKGFCLATDSLFPNLSSFCYEVLGDDNPFEALLEDLEPETMYHLRAYAVNEIDSAFGKTQSFETLRGIPEVRTLHAENVETNSALLGGEILNSGASGIINRGVCYSQENTNPDFNDSCVNYEEESQVFQILLEDLELATQYYFSAFAENEHGHHFGHSLSFITKHETIVDIEGNVYRIHTIGEQTWMIDNLKVTKFSNGDPIPLREDDYYWTESTAIAEPAYSWYNNDESYSDPYGALYNFHVASDERNVCPSGWKVMSRDELITFIVDLGGHQYGGDLKTTGTIENGDGLWYAPNTNATNSTGFSAIPGGIRNTGTGWMGKIGFFWTSTGGGNHARAMDLHYNDYQVGIAVVSPHYGASIRCVKE